MNKHKKYISNRVFFTKTRALIILATLVFSVVSGYFNQDMQLYLTSVLVEKEHPAYDGLVYPIKRVPNWTELTEVERNANYSEIPGSKFMDLPLYDNGDLTFPFDELVWGNDEHDRIRDVQITYSVPYLGSYELDGYEYTGSHPGVDIKAPTGTPVYAIGNGIVTKAQSLSTGFGKHVVITHKRFPSLADSSRDYVVHSSYSHLNSYLVEDGDIVLKGQLIGYVGDTGFATTPHLHFQIDNDEPAWHPYWPFSSSEASAAGLSFIEAINAAFKQDEAIRTTVHPFKYILQYYNESVLVAAVDTPQPTIVVDEPEPEPAVEPKPDLVADVANETFKMEIVLENDELLLNQINPFTLRLVGGNGSVLNTVPDDDITLELASGVGVLDTTVVHPTSFISGQARFHAAPKSEDDFQIKAWLGEEYVLSDVLNAAATIVPSVVFPDVPEPHRAYDAIADLVNQGFLAGYPDGTFGPENTVNRAEVVKFLYAAVASGLSLDEFVSVVLSFSDVPDGVWYVPYLQWGYSDEVIKGNPDGTYRGGNPVNAAEFFKMLFLALAVDVDPEFSVDLPAGFDEDAWYAPSVATAVQMGVLVIDESASGDISPMHEMTRAEVAEVIYRVLKMQEKGWDTWR